DARWLLLPEELPRGQHPGRRTTSAAARGEHRQGRELPRWRHARRAPRPRAGRMHRDARHELSCPITARRGLARIRPRPEQRGVRGHRPRAPISPPLAWDGVTPKLDPAQFTIRTLEKRLAKVDPWKDFKRRAVKLPG